MGTILTFGTAILDSSEVVSVEGFIDYLFLKMPRLRGFTRVQVSSEVNDELRVRAVVNSAKYTQFENAAITRNASAIAIGSKNWGTFLISSISQSVRVDESIEMSLVFEQVAPGIVSPDFGSFPGEIIGSFGLIDLGRSELISPLSESLRFPFSKVELLRELPIYQPIGDDLREVELRLNFREVGGVTAQTRLDTFRSIADSYSDYPLIVKNENYGDYLISSIRWALSLTDGNGEPIAIAATIGFLQSPAAYPPRFPIILSIVVNSVERVGDLGEALVGLTYEDPDGGTSLLELEFDSDTTATLPVEGDAIAIKFGWQGEASLPSTNLVDTGTHRCDYPRRRYKPNITTIGCQSYNYALEVNSSIGVSYFDFQLNSLLADVATEFGLILNSNASTNKVGTTDNISLQVAVSDDNYLDLLRQLAVDYGYSFQLRYGAIKFYSYSYLEGLANTFSLTPTDCLAAEFIQKVKGTFRQCNVDHKGGSVTANDFNSLSSDIIDLDVGLFHENASAAFERGEGELKKFNRSQHIGVLEVEGDYRAIATSNIGLVSFDNANDNGKFQIDKATHLITASGGWTVRLDIRKVF